jgi:hypothetical protein
MTKQIITVGHSPDPDDAFMFYALAHDKIDTGNLQFRHELQVRPLAVGVQHGGSLWSDGHRAQADGGRRSEGDQDRGAARNDRTGNHDAEFTMPLNEFVALFSTVCYE